MAFSDSRITPEQVRQWKGRSPRPIALTAYDYPTARIFDEAGAEILHVGDSLGMVLLGLPDTTHVTMEMMIHHVRAVANAKPHALITADLPAHSYDSPQHAIDSSQALVKAGADAVKMEGGQSIAAQIVAVLAEGIAVQGHLGMLPQHVIEEGGYKRKGRTPAQRESLLADAKWMENAGIFSIVLECVSADVAEEITHAISIPTFGIASGNVCDGEIRVTYDLLGMTPWYVPPYVTPFDHFAERAKAAIQKWHEEMMS